MKNHNIALNNKVQLATADRKEERIMRTQTIRQRAVVVALLVALAMVSHAGAQTNSSLTISDGDHRAHILPPPSAQSGLSKAPALPLTYHGGRVMLTATPYVIFWAPPTLQDGKPGGLGLIYELVQYNVMRLYSGHGIDNNNTQYYGYQNNKVFFDYIQNAGGFGGLYFDTSPYPASGCTDPITPGDCLTDAQIQTEIRNVMALKGWTGGLDKMYLIFTAEGEGSCLGSYCAYTAYCAYHSSFNVGSTPVIYGNEPYGDRHYCQVPGTPSPNYDPDADTAATAASHELTEAITDPLLDAWYDANGEEIGDKCAYNYGSNTWDYGMANQSWNGFFFELQMEYDNHTGTCVQVGP